MTQPELITTPDSPALGELCAALAARAAEVDVSGQWPAEQLELCGKYGVFRWFLPSRWGGLEWSEADLLRGYLRLSAACLTTTFIITQRSAACRRIVESENAALKDRLLPGLAAGETFATVGISHLTTSRRHLHRPVLVAVPSGEGYVLDGFSPWVTGARHAQTLVVGATLEDGQQLLVALSGEAPGVTSGPSARLMGLSASDTGEVRCDGAHVGAEWVLSGPMRNVLSHGHPAGGAGGLQTSALAIGLASACIDYLFTEAEKRPDLLAPAGSLREEHAALEADLLALAAGREVCASEELRARANSLALRSSEATLAAAKGSGYVIGHPAARWCREALFFLVWSCPHPVVTANLCELAGLS